jgi:hypothetical protein
MPGEMMQGEQQRRHGMHVAEMADRKKCESVSGADHAARGKTLIATRQAIRFQRFS